MFMPTGELHGRTSRGSRFEASYSMSFATHDLVDHSRPLIVQYGLTRATIGRPPRNEGRRRYAINNLFVAVNHLEEGRRRIRMPMRFELPNEHLVDIYRVRDYDLRVRAMTAQKSCVVTAYAETIAPERKSRCCVRCCRSLTGAWSIGFGRVSPWRSSAGHRADWRPDFTPLCRHDTTAGELPWRPA